MEPVRPGGAAAPPASVARVPAGGGRLAIAVHLAVELDLEPQLVGVLRGSGGGIPPAAAARPAPRGAGTRRRPGRWSAAAWSRTAGKAVEVVLGRHPLAQPAPLGLVDPQGHDDLFRIADAGLIEEVGDAGLLAPAARGSTAAGPGRRRPAARGRGARALAFVDESSHSCPASHPSSCRSTRRTARASCMRRAWAVPPTLAAISAHS